MMLGIWRNVEELEDSLCLEELRIVVDSSREREYRNYKFFASLKGIDLDESVESPEDKFDAVKRRVEAAQRGVSTESLEMDELGLDIEVEE